MYETPYEAPYELSGQDGQAQMMSSPAAPAGSVTDVFNEFGLLGATRVFDTSTLLPMPGMLPGKNLQPVPFKTEVSVNFGIEMGPLPQTTNEDTVLLSWEEIEARIVLSQWYTVTVPEGADVDVLLASLLTDSRVVAAEENGYFELTDGIPGIDVPIPDGNIPNVNTDPLYDSQWHLDATNVQRAWLHLEENQINPGGNRDIIIAVIDTGVDYTHPDLVGNMWVNPGEIPGNGVDDDQNGFVDDVHGASVVSAPVLHTGDPQDLHGHGTHVAGIVASSAFNTVGGVGMAFNTQIMAIRAAQASGRLVFEDIAEGILYAVDNGADVINMSFGGYYSSQLVEDALDVAVNRSILVAAAGNDAAAVQMFPARLPYVIGVEARTETGKKAWFSNPGDVGAPGTGILSTIPGGGYSAWSGTSMAAPVVSGIAALVRSYYYHKDVYSSRFLSACIVSAGQGTIDAYAALTSVPPPGVSLYRTWIFDDPSINPINDGDGVIDSGETIHLGVEMINRGGPATEVYASIGSRAPGAVFDNPYITFETSQVDFGNAGPFAMIDNGLIYEDGIISGVSNPFVFTVDQDCPNNEYLFFQFATEFRDGWVAEPSYHNSLNEFYFVAQRGEVVPSVIERGNTLTLTRDKYWIVMGPTTIEEKAKLIIEPGTYVQFGAISYDPYNAGPHPGLLIVRGKLDILGTAADPVYLFPSSAMPGEYVTITPTSRDLVRMEYVDVQAPNITAETIDHGRFWVDYANSPTINATTVSNSIFNMGNKTGGSINVTNLLSSIVDNTWIGRNVSNYTDTVVLADALDGGRVPDIGVGREIWFLAGSVAINTTYIPSLGKTFGHLRLGLNSASPDQFMFATELAEALGGSLMTIESPEKWSAVRSWMLSTYKYTSDYRLYTIFAGLEVGLDGNWQWVNGLPAATNWFNSSPPAANGNASTNYKLQILRPHSGIGSPNTNPVIINSGNYAGYVMEFPGYVTADYLYDVLEHTDIFEKVLEELPRRTNVGNAYLRPLWSPILGDWLRLRGYYYNTKNNYSAYYGIRSGNYFSTDNPELIDLAIYDTNDNGLYSNVYYGTPLSHGVDTTYPFVESLYIDGIDALNVPVLNGGYSTFEFTFNRDMDIQVQPFATFGPADPMTDFSINPVGNNWAVFTVTLSQPVSEEFYVDYTTVDGTALAGVDYVVQSNKVRFRPGQTEQVITIELIGNIEEQSGRSFSVLLSNPTKGRIDKEMGESDILDDDYSLSIADVTVVEGDELTQQTVLFEVTLSNPADRDVTVEYRTVPNWDMNKGEDYDDVSGVLTFLAGETVQTIEVTVYGDNDLEDDETVRLIIEYADTVEITRNEATLTITDDDPEIFVAEETYHVIEGDTDNTIVDVIVQLTKPASREVTLNYTTVDGTAIAGEHYDASVGTLTFAPGETSRIIPVTIYSNTEQEPNRAFTMTLSDAVDEDILTPLISFDVTDNDGGMLSITDASLIEGDSGTTYMDFEVTLSEASDVAVTVDYATANATADSSDYAGQSGILTYVPGETTKTISIGIKGDVAYEPDGEFYINLLNASVGITDPQGVGTIINDDATATLSSAEIIEGSSLDISQMVFTVTLDVPSARQITVDYVTGSDSAVAEVDFETTAGQLVFEPGEQVKTIEVEIYGNDVDDADRSFLMNLVTPVNVKLANTQSLGTLLDDDNPILTVEDVQITENKDGTVYLEFRPNLSATPHWNASVDYEIVGVTATAFEDFAPSSGTFYFSTQEVLERRFRVPIYADTLDELPETLELRLSNPIHMDLDRTAITATLFDDLPIVSVDSIEIAEGDSGTATATFTVSLSQSPVSDLTVSYATVDGTAIAAEDYIAATGSLTFTPGGPTTQTVDVTILGDTVQEANQDFTLEITDAGHGSADEPGRGTILADDGLIFTLADASLREGDSGTNYMQFLVTISDIPAEMATLSYHIESGTATASVDMQAVSGTLAFDDTTPLAQTILVPVFGDLNYEGDEAFQLIVDGTTYAYAVDLSATGTILGDDPQLTTSDVNCEEGLTGDTMINIPVTLSHDPFDTVTVDYYILEGTATNGVDFLDSVGSLTFEPGGELTQNIEVHILGDMFNETNETFSVMLVDPVNTASSPFVKSASLVTIFDDDGAKIQILDAAATEGDDGNTQLQFTVELTEAVAFEVIVDYQTQEFYARESLDFLAASGTLTFAPGDTQKTFLVGLIGDNIDEMDETFLGIITSDSELPVLQEIATGTIVDNDIAGISIDDITTDEGYNGWITSREWVGSQLITPITGDGYQFIHIRDAVASDDPWLVTGRDSGRYRFKVSTMSVEAMELQASGHEGEVRLSWMQDDYELLAGYHLYRSDAAEGTYERLNATIIAPGEESFTDTDVQPATEMFYKFTVVGTDMSESDFSNVAMASASDTIPPVIQHSATGSATAQHNIRITAEATDNIGVESVTLFFRARGSEDAWTSLSMLEMTEVNTYSAIIPAMNVVAPGVEYYIFATDGTSVAYNATATLPHEVVVDNIPTLVAVSPPSGVVQGGQLVSLSGTLFQEGAQVYFDGVPATDVTFLSENQITCRTPAHVPMLVDVTVVNPDESQATRVSGFQYTDDSVILTVPGITGDYGETVPVAINVSTVSGLQAVDLRLLYDPSVVSISTVEPGVLTDSWIFESNTNTNGVVIVSMATTTPVTGSGVLIYIEFTLTGNAGATTALTIDSDPAKTSLNGGAIQPTFSSGTITINEFYSLGGTVNYFGGGTVPDVDMTLLGTGTHQVTSDTSGQFLLEQIPSGSYNLFPVKNGHVSDITAYDASFILQKSAGLRTLNANQTTAADVNKDGNVNAMDAVFVLEAAAGLRSAPFPGAGLIWDFSPKLRSYGLLSENKTNQNYTAILLGDVTGNWAAPNMLSAAQTAFEIQSINVAQGNTFTLPITIDSGEEAISALDLVISYDPAALRLDDILIEDGQLVGDFATMFNTTIPGQITIVAADSESLVRVGELLTLQFTSLNSLGFTDITFSSILVDEETPTIQPVNSLVNVMPPTATVSDALITSGDTTVISIMISGGTQVDGLVFAARLTGGSGTAPTITGVNLVGTAGEPTIWYGISNPPFGVDISPDGTVVTANIDTLDTATATADGVLALVTIDTTGCDAGDWTLELIDGFGDPMFLIDGEGELVSPTLETGTLSILPIPTASIADVSMFEGDTGSTDMTVTIQLDVAATYDITIVYATSDGTATTADGDYAATTDTLIIAAGSLSGTFTVPVSGDLKVESDETFNITLSSPVGATIGDGAAVGMITNDDTAIITIEDITLDEGDAGTTDFEFTVSLSTTSDQPISVDYATSDGTATTADGDYAATTDTLIIAAGSLSGTFTVQVIGDENIESDEAFNVTLSDAVGATIGDGSAVGTITNDDFATGTIVGRHVFYNGSLLDGGNPDANPADDAAIATDKTALLPGGTAEFANYTSYLGGITGVMIDIAGIGNAAGIGANDFELLVGNVDDVSTWTEVPETTLIMVRSIDVNGDTIPDFDRITLTFAEGEIVGRWLSVTVAANTDTGIPADDTFYFGNAPCETGNSPTDAIVTPVDAENLRAMSTVYNWHNAADITIVYDFNRDGRVNARDSVKVRFNYTDVDTALKLITPTTPPAPIPPQTYPLPQSIPVPTLSPTVESTPMSEDLEAVALVTTLSTQATPSGISTDSTAPESTPPYNTTTGSASSIDQARELALQTLLIEDESPALENDPLNVEDALLDRPNESDLADEVFALIGDQEV